MSFTGNGINTNEITGVITQPFFPEIDLEAFASMYEISSDYNAALVKQKAVDVIGAVNRELASQREAWQSEGFNTLADVSSELILDKSVLVAGYETTVYSLLKARLMRVVQSSIREDDRANYVEEMRALEADSRITLSAMKNKTVSFCELL